MGRPVQAELSAETGLDVALDALVDLANGKRTKQVRKQYIRQENLMTRNVGLDGSRADAVLQYFAKNRGNLEKVSSSGIFPRAARGKLCEFWRIF